MQWETQGQQRQQQNNCSREHPNPQSSYAITVAAYPLFKCTMPHYWHPSFTQGNDADPPPTVLSNCICYLFHCNDYKAPTFEHFCLLILTIPLFNRLTSYAVSNGWSMSGHPTNFLVQHSCLLMTPPFIAIKIAFANHFLETNNNGYRFWSTSPGATKSGTIRNNYASGLLPILPSATSYLPLSLI